MVLLLSRPAAPPVPHVSPWGSLKVVWEGWDGSVWDLRDFPSGIDLLVSGVEGFHFPKMTRWSSTSRAIPGNRPRGWQAQARSVFLPLFLWSDGTDDWVDLHDRFFRTIHPDKAGTLTVSAGSQSRSLSLTGVFDDSYSYERDPLKVGWAQYPVLLEAAAPYWVGDEVVSGPWQAHSGASFFPGPPFHIGSSATLTSAQITNPCPVDLWPVWECVGPLSSVELGISGRTIVLPFDVPDGQTLVIDTDPRHPAATLAGVDVLTSLGLQAYAPVPAFGTSPLAITASGTGSVSCTIQTLYFQAF